MAARMGGHVCEERCIVLQPATGDLLPALWGLSAFSLGRSAICAYFASRVSAARKASIAFKNSGISTCSFGVWSRVESPGP